MTLSVQGPAPPESLTCLPSLVQGLHRHTLGLLSDALALWPNVPVKIHFLNKLLDTNIAQGTLDPPPAARHRCYPKP